jgi:hypothetical protein
MRNILTGEQSAFGRPGCAGRNGQVLPTAAECVDEVVAARDEAESAVARLQEQLRKLGVVPEP